MSVPVPSSRDGWSRSVPSLRLIPLPPEVCGPPAPAASQPRPISVLLCDIPCGTTVCTAIARVWNEGDPARCRLCPTCSADANNVCLVVAPHQVPDAAAALFALREDARMGAG
jgi:hypothetical protein